MASDHETFLREFFQSLPLRPLEPGDSRYVRLYDDPALVGSDPVKGLMDTIAWTASSVQLLSGFRGTGKSTELLRLKQHLEEVEGAKVVYCDMEDFLNFSTRVDVSDFLLAVAGAVGEALRAPELLGEDMREEGYWTRFVHFLRKTKVDLSEVGLNVGAKAGAPGAEAEAAATVKANLKADPSFKQELQAHLKGHLGALTQDVHAFMTECVALLRRKHGEHTTIAVLVDSVEHVRGTSLNAGEVFGSIESLFSGHPDKLRLPAMHVVYTVPPWLQILVPGVAKHYDHAEQLPCVKVRHKSGEVCPEGLELLTRVVAERGDWARLLGSKEQLERLLMASGGFLRDLFRMLQGVLRHSRHRGVPASDEVVQLVLDELWNSYVPLADEDALWLDAVRRTKEAQLPDLERLPTLARFFDTALVFNYRNGRQWLDVHPLLVETIREQAERVRVQSGS